MAPLRLSRRGVRAPSRLQLLAAVVWPLVWTALAAGQVNVRLLDTLTAPLNRHLSPVVAFDGEQIVVAYTPPQGLYVATLDCAGVQLRSLYAGTAYPADLAIDSLGGLNLAHRVGGWSEIAFTLDSPQLPGPATVRVTGSMSGSPYGVGLTLDEVDRPLVVGTSSSQYVSGSRFSIQSGTWATQLLTTMPKVRSSPRQVLAVARDGHNRALIAYLDVDSNVTVLTDEGSGWRKRSTSGLVYEDMGIAAARGPDGSAVVAAFGDGALRLLRVGDLGLTIETISSAPSFGHIGPKAVAIDSNGVIRIVGYANLSAPRLTMMTSGPAGWTVQDLGPVTLQDVYGAPSIAVDARNRWAVAYYDSGARAVLVKGTAVPKAITGTYQLSPGRWAECRMNDGLAEPGSPMHASSWSESGLAALWDLSGLTVNTVEEVANTVDGEGNGQIVYRLTYAGEPVGVFNLHDLVCDTTQSIVLDGLMRIAFLQVVAGQYDWPNSTFDVIATGHLSDYPQYAVQLGGQGTFEGLGPELPADYPGPACPVGAAWQFDWGSITHLTLGITDCASDDDLDGVPHCSDNCPNARNPEQADLDGDTLGDTCDPDRDGDGVDEDGDHSGVAGDNPCSGENVSGCDDNCSGTANADQLDADRDRVGDACDACGGTVTGSPVDVSGCPPLIPGDFERDGDVDGDDYAVFIACTTGPQVPGPLGECPPAEFEAADADLDGDVDQDDFGAWQRCYSGPDVPGRPACRE